MRIIDRKFLKTQTKTCHAASICFYKDKPVFSFFGSDISEGAPDSAIYIQYDDKVINIGKNDQIPRWNPILFPCNNKLFLFIKIGIHCDRWNTMLYDLTDIFEDNFNINKIKPQIVPAGINGPVKTKCIEKNGLIYCGSSVESIIDWSSYIELWSYNQDSDSLIFVNRTSPLTVDKRIYDDPWYGKRLSLGIIQPSLWTDKKDIMHAFFRSSRGLGKIYYSFSNNEMNDIWYPPKPTHFENPNSGMDTVYTKDGRLFLVYNPSDKNRFPLVIHELEDNMFTIIDELIVMDKIPEDEVVNSPELSYPYMIEHNNQLCLCYTYGRKKIEQCVISID